MSDSPAAAEEPALAAVHEHRCPRCGGATSLAPGTDELACGHCGATTPIDVAPAVIPEYDFEEARGKAGRASLRDLVPGGREIQCGTCGARATLSDQAGRCPFCDSPVVVASDASEVFTPEGVLPHAVPRDDAEARYKQWLGSRWFAPGDLRSRARTQPLDGAYLPYWCFDAQTTTRYTGLRGTYYTVAVQRNGRTVHERKVRWSPAAGSVEVDFDDLLVCASTTLPRPLVERLEPWDLDELRPFDPRFLAGFAAERYQVELEPGFDHARDRMAPTITTAIRRDIGGDTQKILTSRTAYADVRFKHLLLPLWISAYRYRDRVYRVLINARTGELQGERPWSWPKLLLLFAVLAALVAAAVWFADGR